MALESGSRLGPYEIESPLGAGGMGEVYKARDTRLERTVAIKVLPSHLSDDPAFRERFEREARAVSGLNHPHICTLHDIGREDDVDFLVMEYMEGETLGTRIQKGPLPLEEALRRSIEIAEALDKAHREGVVHRDLKPGNIMLTGGGAKLLDFGLAKRAAGRVATDSALSALPTEAQPLTREGAILGTFQYMAPEQLEGKEADARSDIFALGAVLYEMLTGRKAFEGKSQASLISAIMSGEPAPISTLQPMSPFSLDHVVRRCLAKDPEKRWQTAGDVARELEWIGETSAPSRDVVSQPARKSAWGLAVPVALAFLVGAALATLLSRREAPLRAPVQRYAIPLAPDQEPTRLGRQLLALSPDGRHLVYEAGGQLHLRPVGSLDSQPIGGTERAHTPFFSPDGEWIGFYSGGKLKKISVTGGAAVTLCDARRAYGASWGEDDTIYFGQGPDGIFRVPGAGGNAEQITSLETGAAHGAILLPGGRAVVYNVGRGNWDEDSDIVLQSFETGERRVLIEGGTDARYLPTGHLVYALEETLLAVPFDVDALEVTGGPVPVAVGVARAGGVTGAAQFTFSSLGTMAFFGDMSSANRLAWMDRDGRIEPLPLESAVYGAPTLSPDGERLAMSIQDGDGSNLWIYDLAREALSKLTFSGEDNFPVWTLDGERLAFGSGNPFNLFTVIADGSQPPERLNTDKTAQIPTSFSGDGAVLAFQRGGGPSGALYLLSLESDAEPEVFVDTPFSELEARFSPDGRWIAYRSHQSGRPEIYVRSYPDRGGRQQISTNGGAQPMWNPRGGELFYKEGDKMMVVDVDTGPPFRASKPRILFESRFPDRVPGDPARYAVTPDGERFVVIVPADDTHNVPKLHVVVNWFDEVLERVPVESR